MKLVAYWSGTMNDSTKLAALVGVLACACSGGSIENGPSNEGQQPGGSMNGGAFATDNPGQIEQETRLVRLSQAQ